MDHANFLQLNVMEVLYMEVNYSKYTAVEHLLPTRPIHGNLRLIPLCSPPHTFVSLKDIKMNVMYRYMQILVYSIILAGDISFNNEIR